MRNKTAVKQKSTIHLGFFLVFVFYCFTHIYCTYKYCIQQQSKFYLKQSAAIFRAFSIISTLRFCSAVKEIINNVKKMLNVNVNMLLILSSAAKSGGKQAAKYTNHSLGIHAT